MGIHISGSLLDAPVLNPVPLITGHTVGSSLTVGLSVYQTNTGTGPLTWTLTNAPSGVTIDATTGLVTVASGTELRNTTGAIGVTVTNAAGASASRPLTFDVMSVSSPVTGTAITIDVDTSLVAQTRDLGALLIYQGLTTPVRWLLYGAPTSVSIAPTTGVATVALGTNAMATPTMWAVGANGALLGVPINFRSVAYNAPALNPVPLLTGHTVGSSLTVGLSVYQTSTGTGPLTWTLTNAPAGVTIDATTGLVTVASGTELRNTTGAIGVTVTNAAGASASRPLTFDVVSSSTPVTGPAVTIDVNTTTSPQTRDMSALSIYQGLTTPLTWSLYGAPIGVTIDPNTGMVTVALGTNATASPTMWVVAANGAYTGVPISFHSIAYNVPVLNPIPVVDGNTMSQPLSVDLSGYQSALFTGLLTWSLVNPPAGVTIDTNTGVLTVNMGVAIESTDGTIGVVVTGMAGPSSVQPLLFQIIAPPAIVGYLNYPGVTHIDTFMYNQPVFNSRSPSSSATIGARNGYIAVYSGVLSGAQTLRVAGPATSLGDFNGGGTVVMTATNTNLATGSIDAGATLQMGIDKNALSGTTAQAFTINGTVNLFGAYTAAKSVIGAGNTIASGGVMNVEGPGTPGTGMIQTFWNSVAAGGTINVKNAFANAVNTGMAGVYNINEGASVLWGPTYTGTINLNSPIGWKNSASVEQPSLLISGGGGLSGKVNVGPLGSSVGVSGGGAFQFNATLTGSGPLIIGTAANPAGVVLSGNGSSYTGTVTLNSVQVQPVGNALVNSAVRLSAGTILLPSASLVTIKSLQTVLPTDSTAKLMMSLIAMNITDQDPEPFYGTIAGLATTPLTIKAGNFQIATTTGTATNNALVLEGNARAGGVGSAAKYGGILTIPTVTGGLSLTANPSSLTVTVFNAPNGFTVDINNAGYTNGAYTILKTNNTGTGVNKIPVTGLNLSGRSPSYQWTAGNLVMTLA